VSNAQTLRTIRREFDYSKVFQNELATKEFRRSLQKKRGTAKASHAKTKGTRRSNLTLTCSDGSGTGASRECLRLAFLDHRNNEEEQGDCIRDFALARRIHGQFAQLFGRPLNPKQDRIKWSWDWSHYGFRTKESLRSGHKKPVGNFPFDTRAQVTEEVFGGFGPKSCQSGREDLRGVSTP
jgi:hypothetical protein